METMLAQSIQTPQFLQVAQERVVLDVRSPGEFAQGHIPGSVNLPLFDDDERAEVGTLYKNSGRDAAVLRGLKFAGQKMAELVICLLYTSPSPRDRQKSRMPSSA